MCDSVSVHFVVQFWPHLLGVPGDLVPGPGEDHPGEQVDPAIQTVVLLRYRHGLVH